MPRVNPPPVIPIDTFTVDTEQDGSVTVEIYADEYQHGGRGEPKTWATALKNAEIVNFRWHDLRHTAASYLAQDGATLIDIAAILGHSTLDMVQRYAHLSDTHISSAVERMNQRIGGA